MREILTLQVCRFCSLSELQLLLTLFLDLGISVLLMGMVISPSRRLLFICFKEDGCGPAVDGRRGAMFVV